MVFRAEVSLYSVDGKEWTVEMVHYDVSDARTGSLGRLKLESLDIVEGILKEGDVLIKRLRKNENTKF